MPNTILLTDDAKLHGSQWLADIPLRAGSQAAKQLRDVQGVRAPITIGPFHADDAIVFLADVTDDVETWRVYKAAEADKPDDSIAAMFDRTRGDELDAEGQREEAKLMQMVQEHTPKPSKADGRTRVAHDLRAFAASARWTDSPTHGIELSTEDAIKLLSRVERENGSAEMLHDVTKLLTRLRHNIHLSPESASEVNSVLGRCRAVLENV